MSSTLVNQTFYNIVVTCDTIWRFRVFFLFVCFLFLFCEMLNVTNHTWIWDLFILKEVSNLLASQKSLIKSHSPKKTLAVCRVYSSHSPLATRYMDIRSHGYCGTEIVRLQGYKFLFCTAIVYKIKFNLSTARSFFSNWNLFLTICTFWFINLWTRFFSNLSLTIN